MESKTRAFYSLMSANQLSLVGSQGDNFVLYLLRHCLFEVPSHMTRALTGLPQVFNVGSDHIEYMHIVNLRNHRNS